jgi:hypothetical protein
MTTLRRQGGRLRLETIVALAIIASLIAVLFDRLLYYE